MHCINVFVPLVDITTTNGATEFCLGSHNATDILPELVWQDHKWRDAIGFTDEPVCYQIPAGSVLLFDYRLLHRGLAHTSPEQGDRPLLYFTYGRRWFSDNLNFPPRAAPPPPTATATATTVATGLDPDALRKEFPALALADADGAGLMYPSLPFLPFPTPTLTARSSHLSGARPSRA
eukprot:COSAG01_NODE_14589_length_1435_cov_2.008234_2_plen_178_part_00